MNRKIKRRLLLLGLAAWPATLLAADKLLGRRLSRRCALPNYNYDVTRGVNPVSANSSKAILWLVNGSGAVTDVQIPHDKREIIKTFQMNDDSLPIDHCRISRVVVTITNKGYWTVSLTAHQDPQLLANPALRPQFERYRRNLFRVAVRPVGLMTLNASVEQAKVAKPEFPFIPPQAFWVQKGEVLRYSKRGYCCCLQNYFHLIKQTEIDFSYEPLQTFTQQTVDGAVQQ